LINVNTGAGISDTYLTFNGSTGKLIYSGKDTDVVRMYDVQFRVNGILFSPFKLRVQRPTFTFGDQSYEALTGITGVPAVIPANFGLGAAMSQRFTATSPDNMVFLTPSTAAADRYYVATISHFKTGLESCYIIGMPGKTKVGEGRNISL
jgi:hypothetical protein